MYNIKWKNDLKMYMNTFGSFIMEGNINDLIQRVDRPRVEESEITGLPYNTLFIKKERHSEIIKAHCIDGNARESYAEPRRRSIRATSYRRFSWLIFILLLILVPPAAFIYSLIVCGRTGKIISGILLVLMVATITTQIVLITQVGL